MTEPGPYPIRAVDRVCDILDVLQGAPEGVSLADVATATDLPKSSVYRYLSALENRRYVEREPTTSLYRLGLAFRPQRTRLVDTLVTCARPHLERLRDRLGETVNLAVLDGAEVVHVLVAESPHMLRLAARTGERGALHSTALGKVLAADLPADRVLAMLPASRLERFTPNTIVTLDGYAAELERVRREGYAVDDCENQPDGRCVAVNLHGLPLAAAISVSAPAFRLPAGNVPDVARELGRTAPQLVKDFEGLTGADTSL